MRSYAVIALKEGLEYLIRRLGSKEEAIEYAYGYWKRTGKMTRVFDPICDRIWSSPTEKSSQ